MTDTHYHPIRLGSGEFRILTLQPSPTFSSGIACTLMNVSLASHPAYEALSYVWGDKTAPLSEIILEGRVKSVTQNLAIALRHLRHTEQPRNLWVDALCIDQQQVNERDDQVMHMREIYQHCATDLLWLGDNMSIIEEGVAAMEEIGSISNLDDEFLQTRISDDCAWDVNREEVEKGTPQSWTNALSAIFYQPQAWKRVWIMQEVSFAPRVVLLAGRSAPLPWERVEQFLDVDNYIQKYGFPDAFHWAFNHGNGPFKAALQTYLPYAQILSHQRRIVSAMQQQQSAQTAPTSSLLDVLARFRHTEATDPRDMVFALLGLTSNPLSITPTYHDSTRAVYTKTATAILNATRTLDLLCQSPWALLGTCSRNPDLPSWVPDFANPGNPHILFAQRGIYAAAGEAALPTPCAVSEDGRLALEGWDAGTVGEVYGVMSRFGSLDVPVEVVAEGRGGNGWGEGCHPDSLGGGALDRFEAYWRTIMVDCKRLPMARLGEGDLRRLRPIWETWLRGLWVVDSGEVAGGGRQERAVREGDTEGMRDLEECLRDAWKMSFATLEDGSYAMVVRYARKGDRVAVLKGAKTPVLLRRVEGSAQGGQGEETWTLVGSCYVHGLMDGEIVEREGSNTRTFVIS